MRIKSALNLSRLFYIKLTAAVSVFVLSILIMPYYTGGDQIQYRKVYSLLPDLNLVQGYSVYFLELSSLEFVHYFFSWIASRFIDKDIFISFFNAILAYVSMTLFQRWKASVIISFVLVLTNYYFIVLYFSAERLKFGFLFLALSLIYSQRTKLNYGMSSLAIMAHAQVLIVYISVIFKAFLKRFFIFCQTGRIPKSFIYSALLLLPPLIVRQQLIDKLQMYANKNGLSELLQVSAFFTLALWYSKRKYETVSLFIPIVIAVFLLGGERLNIFAYFVFLYYGFQVRRGWNIGVIVTTLYFMIGSGNFLNNVFKYGDGYLSP